MSDTRKFYDAAARETLAARASGDMTATANAVGHVIAEADTNPAQALANLNAAIQRNK